MSAYMFTCLQLQGSPTEKLPSGAFQTLLSLLCVPVVPGLMRSVPVELELLVLLLHVWIPGELAQEE